EVLRDLDDAARLGALTVRADLEKIDPDMAVDRPAEIRCKDEAALQDHDENQVPVLVLLGDLLPELLHSDGNLLGGQHRNQTFAHESVLSVLDAPRCKETTVAG